jgi:hypothetical protein
LLPAFYIFAFALTLGAPAALNQCAFTHTGAKNQPTLDRERREMERKYGSRFFTPRESAIRCANSPSEWRKIATGNLKVRFGCQ